MENATELTWREYAKAYVRVAGIFVPTRFVWRPFGTLLELDRCQVDGRLVGESQAALSRHQGHTLKQPVLLSLLELLLVWVRWIR